MSATGNGPDRQTRRIEEAYLSERPRLIAGIRAAGRTLEEAEDILHDVYAETVARVSVLSRVRNLPAWLNTSIKRRMIDLWRHDRVKEAAGESDVAEETLNEIIAGAGFDPLEEFVRENLVSALNEAIRALPGPQRQVVEAQVFGGLTFREISESTGESIDTLTARKRYAMAKLSSALRQWIDQ